MSYPVWEVPNIGNGWVIGLIAILHVFISHFAIGGGAFLALTEQLAFEKQDNRIYDYLKRHSKFFLLITTVLGAISGVGIWWSIGLANPNGTQTLIQNFSLFWAVEWIFFAVELATFLAYYYTFGKMDRKEHLKLGWIYFGVSFFTLFVINGILTFMLNSGGWFADGNIYQAFFNPSFWSALFLRLFIMFALAGIYALVTAAVEKDPEVKHEVLKYSSKWLLPALVAGPVALTCYLFTLPPATLDVIMQGISTMGEGNFSILSRAIFLAFMFATGLIALAFVGPYLNPKGFNRTFAIMMLACGFGFMFTEEWSREMMRKPYVVYNYMYSNGVRKVDVDKLNANGYIQNHPFASAEMAALPANATAEEKGEIIFRYQCVSCHTAMGNGYRSMHRLLGSRDKDAIANLLKLMRDNHKVDKDGKGITPYHGFMPPVVGKQNEVDELRDYLVSISPSAEGNTGHMAMK
ncbi:MAG: hypothetical protein ACKO34_02430 [Vampirovibrionales bacterium]